MPRRTRRVAALVCCIGWSAACGGELRLVTEGRDGVDAVAPDVGMDETSQFDVEPPVDAIELDGDAPLGRCQLDIECRLTTLHCDVFAGCVPCLVDADCPTKERKRCDASLHRCVECGLSADCGAGYVCEPSTRKCVATCAAGTVCPPEAKTCDAARGLCVTCVSDAICGAKKHCELPSGRCLDCVADRDCPLTHPRCDAVVGHCVTCLTSADCPTKTPFCDPATGNCVTG
jgi:hypothetical protein